jgi:membrane carboxypeptidase/penicillin-binding protein PbpC
MLALYAHFMQFEGGRGLTYGAEHYYGSLPSELSDREALELFVISKSPAENSPSKNPGRFRSEVERLSILLAEPAA